MEERDLRERVAEAESNVTDKKYERRMKAANGVKASDEQLAEIMASVAALRKPKEDEPSFM
jgi:hypothetical protein